MASLFELADHPRYRPKFPEPLVDRSKLVRHFNVHPCTIRRWEREGLQRVVYSPARYRLSEVEAWVAKRGGPDLRFRPQSGED